MTENRNSRKRDKTARRILVAGAGLVLSGMGAAFGQDPPAPDSYAPQMAPQPPGSQRGRMAPMPPPPPDFFAPPPIVHVRDFSWAYVGIPEPREILVHDILTIIVNEKAEVNSQSRYNRQRNGNLKAEIKDFIRIGEDGTLDNAADNQPTVDTNLQGRLQSSGQLSDQESIKYRIAATVVDVLPNGNIVLEARKSIRSNKDMWEYSLTGVLRPQDINPDNTALSENIANLDIVKRSRGTVFDSTQRPWGLWLYDKLAPF
ncbi:MAG: flagellar basal body L-ring protein FlgH [Planctomycetaceae bacterium]